MWKGEIFHRRRAADVGGGKHHARSQASSTSSRPFKKVICRFYFQDSWLTLESSLKMRDPKQRPHCSVNTATLRFRFIPGVAASPARHPAAGGVLGPAGHIRPLLASPRPGGNSWVSILTQILTLSGAPCPCFGSSEWILKQSSCRPVVFLVDGLPLFSQALCAFPGSGHLSVPLSESLSGS